MKLISAFCLVLFVSAISAQERTSATRSEKQRLAVLRGVINDLDVESNSAQNSINNIRFVQIPRARAQLRNAIRERASPAQINEARQQLRSVQARLEPLRESRREFNVLKWCLRRCIQGFLRDFNLGQFQQCESTCFLTNPVRGGIIDPAIIFG